MRKARRGAKLPGVSRFLQATARALLPLVLAASAAGAQIIRPRASGEPDVFASLAVGYLDAQGIYDGRTQSAWDFGSGAQFRASLEKSIGNSTGVGVSATLARLPLVYDGPACSQCDAHANVWSVMASFSGGGGAGLHGVLQGAAGFTRFENFRQDETGSRLAPEGDTDFSFAFATGFGFSTASRLEFFLVQEYAGVIHQREGVGNDQSTLSRQLVTRIGARYGMGQRRR